MSNSSYYDTLPLILLNLLVEKGDVQHKWGSET